MLRLASLLAPPRRVFFRRFQVRFLKEKSFFYAFFFKAPVFAGDFFVYMLVVFREEWFYGENMVLQKISAC